jgi:excisionase family DNA binding protein
MVTKLTIKESAHRLGISRSKLYPLVERREIAHYRTHSKILFSEEQLQKVLANCKVEVGPAQRLHGAWPSCVLLE